MFKGPLRYQVGKFGVLAPFPSHPAHIYTLIITLPQLLHLLFLPPPSRLRTSNKYAPQLFLMPLNSLPAVVEAGAGLARAVQGRQVGQPLSPAKVEAQKGIGELRVVAAADFESAHEVHD